MQNKNNLDILKELEILEKNNNFSLENIIEEKKNLILEKEDILEKIEKQENSLKTSKKQEDILEIINEKQEDILDNIYIQENIKKNNGIINLLFKNIIFLFKYVATSAFIFTILLVTTNYSAYIDITMSYLNKDNLQKNEQSLISSVKASYIQEKIVKKEVKTIKMDKKHSELYKRNIHGVKKLINNKTNKNLKLNINITPYENRLIIPKIGKNIPLLDVKNQQVSSDRELENIFMDELKDGVVRYPGTAKPGEKGNSFIFGHSSNFPWVKGNYNQVFALIDKIVYGDKIIVYYGQKKYTYIVREKKIISPNDVSALKRNKGKSEITLMACWPIGTTLNRILVIGELIEE